MEMNKKEELILRESIRHILVKKLNTLILQERSTVNSTPDAPYDITAMNFLSTLINNHLKKIEVAYKSLTTSQNQRKSFSAHILNGVEELLGTADSSPSGADVGKNQIEEEIDINFDEETEQDPFSDEGIIDIRDDEEKKEKEESEEEKFASSISGRGLDMTGRNKAYDTFGEISKQILTSYNMIDTDSIVPAAKVPSLGRDTSEREVFKIYLIKNLDLYMKKFEEELEVTPDLPNLPI